MWGAPLHDLLPAVLLLLLASGASPTTAATTQRLRPLWWSRSASAASRPLAQPLTAWVPDRDVPAPPFVSRPSLLRPDPSRPSHFQRVGGRGLVAPFLLGALVATPRLGGPQPLPSSRNTGDPTPSGRSSSGQLAAQCLRSVALVLLLYGWFFKGLEIIRHVVDHYPMLHVPVYFVLASIPALCLRNRIFHPSLLDAIAHTDAVSRSRVARHVLSCVLRLVDDVIQATLVFFATNLLVNAIPDEQVLGLPRSWHFISGTAVTGAQFERWFQNWSGRLLGTVVWTLGVQAVLRMKAPPRDPDLSPGGNLVERYWAALRRGRGRAIVVDLLLSIVISSVAWLQWLRFFGIPPETVLTFGGAGGLAVGIASQRVVGNLVSGLLLLVTQPFSLGDEIQAGGQQGTVQAIGWSSTTIKTGDGGIVLIPNGSIIGAETTNLSVSNTRVLRLVLPIVMPSTRAEGDAVLEAVRAALQQHTPLATALLAPPQLYYDFPANARPLQPTINIDAAVDGRLLDGGSLPLLKSSVLLTVIDTLHQHQVKVTGTA